MEINFVKHTDFGWHVVLDSQQEPWSLKLANTDVQRIMRREVTADDYADAVQKLERGERSSAYPSLEVWK